MAIPPLPDTERLTSYTIAVADDGPFSVGFQIYADGSDYAQFVEVWLNGVQQVGNWTLTSLAGGADLTIIARPITDARITFTTPITGELIILGARRPRQASQFRNGISVTADQHNRRYTDIMATLREFWDLRSRMFLTPPGVEGSIIDGVLSGIFGPGSSADEVIIRWNGVGGVTVQGSEWKIDDSGNMTGIAAATAGVTRGNRITVPAQTSTNQGHLNWQDQGAAIHRLNDRVLVGAATDNDGTVAQAAKDWLEALVSNSASIGQTVSISRIGGHGIVGASRSSDAGDMVVTGLGFSTGVSAFAIADDAVNANKTVTAFYSETRKFANSAPVLAVGNEFDIIVYNGATVSNHDPYNIASMDICANLWLASGRPDITGGVGDATVAIGILNNSNTPATSGRYMKGITVHSDAIVGTNGVTGTGEAIALARGHKIGWWQEDQTSAPQAYIVSLINSPSPTVPTQGIEFTDTGIHMETPVLTVGNGSFGLIENGSNPFLTFDSGDIFGMFRASSTFFWNIATVDEMYLSATSLRPAANDGLTLGTSTSMWSDLFLAPGGVINWNNGAATISETSGALGVAATTTSIVGSNNPALYVTRDVGGTTGGQNIFRMRARTSGDMADTFGALLSFEIEDNAGVANTIGQIRAIRNGADNTGYVGVNVVNAGVNTEAMRVDKTTTAAQTALLIWDNDNAILERVTVAAADSGGAGFKVLRIPN